MQRLKDGLVGFLLGGLVFLAGMWMGSSPESALAHDTHGDRYMIYTSPYDEHSWYALKLDRTTGEVLVLDAKKGSGGDKWKLIPQEGN